ncbi:MAG: LPP20 family lipoprotein [Bacteroidales bacterium]|nr:LPP20 family lipoprotein [Bacteroidales bacterium]MCF8404412.1 LPP20 family lipoprotein [Bacteroidales bacterium]
MKRIFFFLLLILSACAAKKQAAELEAQPLWMKQKPEIPGYYVGVGSAKKVGTPYQYQEAAKKDALANLAESIAVNISSTSVLHTIETKKGFTDLFDQKIKVTSDDYLEGFEPVEFYENNSDYWVYFRISKQVYAENKEKKKQEALFVAKEKYTAGKKAEIIFRPLEAVSFYLEGLEAITNYLGEQNLVEFNENSVDIGNELYTAVSDILSGLQIKKETPDLNISPYENELQPLVFTTNFNNRSVKGIPVKLSYSGGYLTQDKAYSDENGEVKLNHKFRATGKNVETVSAAINQEEIAQKAVKDLFIRALLTKQKIDPAEIRIYIKNTSVAIELPDHYCNLDPCELIKNSFNELMLKEGFEISDSKNANYTFSVKFSYSKGERAGNLTSLYLNGELQIINHEGIEIWRKDLTEVKGIGSSEDSARQKAFSDFYDLLKRVYFKQGIYQIK